LRLTVLAMVIEKGWLTNCENPGEAGEKRREGEEGGERLGEN